MNILLKGCLLLIIFLNLNDLIGQTNFRPGYVITNDNDTLHGFIDYRGEARNSKKCDFKVNQDSDVKEFKPFSIKGYRFIDSKFYISKSIKYKGEEIQVFLEFLVDGISDLYSYSDGTAFHYFIEKANTQLFELTNEQQQFKRDGVDYSRASNKYIGLLKYAFADCQQIFALINKAKLEDKSLIEITKKYHEYVCNDQQCIIYEKQLPVIKVTFGSFVSMNGSFLKFNESLIYEGIHFKMASYPSIGLQLNTTMPRVNEKLSLVVSGEFGKSYFYGTGMDFDYTDFEEVHLHTSILKVKGGFKYTYPKGKIRPTLMIGGNVLKLIKSEGRRIHEVLWNSIVYTSESNDVPVANVLLGYNADLGIDYHLSSSMVAFFNLGYESSIGSFAFFDSKITSTIINTINLHAGIYF